MKNLMLTALSVMLFGAAAMAQNLNLNWVKSIGNISNTGTTQIEKDNQGNIYISGGFIGTLDFDPGLPIFSLTSQNTTYGDNYLLKLDPNGNFLWVKQWNLNPTNDLNYSAGNSTNGFVFKVINNGIYIASGFTGTTDLNPNSGTNNVTVNGSSFWDAFILKLDLSGNYIWAHKFGGSNRGDFARNIAFDSNNNMFILGYFGGTADFDFGASVNSLTSNGAADCFILKTDSNGNFIWVKQFGGTADDDFLSLEIDQQNNIYFGGGYYSSGSIDMDPNAGTFNLTSNGISDIPLGKLDNNGNFLWARNIGNASQNSGSFKLNQISNQILLFGEYSGVLDLDPSASNNNVVSNGAKDIFLVGLNSSGNYQWSTSFGGSGDETIGNLRIDSIGQILITGSFTQSVDFNPSMNTNIISSAGLKDIYLSIFSTSGNYITTKTFGNTGNDFGSDITTFSPDNIYLTGVYSGTVDFDPSSGIANLTSAGQLDNFVLKLNSSFCAFTTYDTVTVTVYDTVTVYNNITVTDTLLINTTVSTVNPPNNINTIRIFPNPASSHITINYGNFALMSGYQLRITNSLGQQMFQTNINQQSDYLDLSSWTGNGIYFVNIIDPSGNTVDIKKIVLQ